MRGAVSVALAYNKVKKKSVTSLVKAKFDVLHAVIYVISIFYS